MQENGKKPINIEIGNNIRKYREICGYSREELAEKIGVSPRFVANIEVGSVGVSPSTIKKVSEVLAVPSDRLLWSNDAPLTIDERLQHIPPKYHKYVHKALLTLIEMIEDTNEDTN